MLNGGKFTSSLQNLLWAEAAQTAKVLQSNLASQQRAMSPYYQFFGKGRTRILDTAQRFDEICIVASHYEQDAESRKALRLAGIC